MELKKMCNSVNSSRICALVCKAISNSRKFCQVRHAHRLFAVISLALWLPVAAIAVEGGPGNSDELELGRRIYKEGMRAAGVEVTGARLGGAQLSGATAACVNCHRRSGMGQVESDILVPPITGNFLFATTRDKRLATMDPHVSKKFNQAHDPYTEAALAAAIRNGINIQGRTMSEVMPRYNLSDVELRALTAYLKQLSSQWSPGVTEKNIHFATVITPDVDPARRKVFIDMMRSIFRQKNGSTMTPNPSRTRHHMTTAAELILGTERGWDLDIWELQGAPETWAEQLSARYRSQPVFALVSGLSNSTWQPVHDFCAHEQVPCWFPSVDVPGKIQSPYAFYFSGGVTLESAVLARHLLDQKQTPKHIVQIYRDDAVGRAAAQALTDALAGSRIAVANRMLGSDVAAVEALRLALDKIDRDDAVMFWLRPDDVAALGQIKPVSGKSYFSALLGKGEHAPLPPDWRANSSLVYPYELAENRAKNLDYFHIWLSMSKLPLVDEAMQSEVFFAMNFMTDTLSEMLDNMYRDYLLDRAESMLSIREGIKSAQETRDRVALGHEGDLARRHGAATIDESARITVAQKAGSSKTVGTTLYPHLSLGPEQRFASKGAYIVRFADASGDRLIGESAWIVP
jgi:cytochrome c553